MTARSPAPDTGGRARRAVGLRSGYALPPPHSDTDHGINTPPLRRDEQRGTAFSLPRQPPSDYSAVYTADEFRRRGGDVVRGRLDVASELGPKPNDRWNVAEQWALNMTVLPIGFRLAAVSLHDREAAVEGADMLVSLCRGFAGDASNPEPWEAAVRLVEEIFAFEEHGGDALCGHAREMFGSSAAPVLPVVAYLGASIQDGLLPQKALAAHLTVVPMTQRFMVSATLKSRVVLPFAARFWQSKFEEMRFRFSHPRSVEPAIARAVSDPTDGNVRAMLRAVASDLRMPLGPQHEEWLRGGSSQSALGAIFVS